MYPLVIHIPITTKYKILTIFSIKLNGQTQLKKWFREMKIKKLSLMGLTSRPSRFSIFLHRADQNLVEVGLFFLIFDSRREELVGGEMFLHVHHKFPFFFCELHRIILNSIVSHPSKSKPPLCFYKGSSDS